VSRCDRNTRCHHRQSAHAHQAPCGGPGQLAPCSLHAAAAGGLHWQPTSVSAPSSRAAARMSGGTDLGHRRRPGPRLARAAPVTPIWLGFDRGTPGFHPEGCAGFNSRSSELKPAQPWELKPAAGIRTSTGTDADVHLPASAVRPRGWRSDSRLRRGSFALGTGRSPMSKPHFSCVWKRLAGRPTGDPRVVRAQVHLPASAVRPRGWRSDSDLRRDSFALGTGRSPMSKPHVPCVWKRLAGRPTGGAGPSPLTSKRCTT
jgi:hypothetical protein